MPSYLILFFKNQSEPGSSTKKSTLSQLVSRVRSDSISLADSDQEDNNDAIKFKMTMFHYPLDFCCPIQKQDENKKNDKLVKLNMKQLQINHMQEVAFRLNDYFFYQLIYAATDTNPYQDFIQRMKAALDPFTDNSKQQQKREGLELQTSRELNQTATISSEQSESELSHTVSEAEVNQLKEEEAQAVEDDEEYYSSSDKSKDKQMEFESEDELDKEQTIPDENRYVNPNQKGSDQNTEKDGYTFKKQVELDNFDVDLKQYPLTT